MRYLKCQICDKFSDEQQVLCHFCGHFFKPANNSDFLKSDRVIDPSLTILLIDLVKNTPGKTGKFYTAQLISMGYDVAQLRVNQSLYYNDQIFKSNLNPNKVPAWTLNAHEVTPKLNVVVTKTIVKEKKIIVNDVSKEKVVVSSTYKSDLDISTNSQSKTSTSSISNSEKGNQAFSGSSRENEERTNKSLYIKHIRIDMSESAKEDYQAYSFDMDNVIIKLMEHGFTDNVSILEIKKKLDSLCSKWNSTQRMFIDHYDKMAEILLFDESKIDYIGSVAKRVISLNKTLIIVDSPYVGRKIGKQYSGFLKYYDLSSKEKIELIDMKNFELGKDRVLLAMKDSLPHQMGGVSFDLCIIVSTLGNEDTLNRIVSNLCISKEANTSIEILCLRNTFEDIQEENKSMYPLNSALLDKDESDINATKKVAIKEIDPVVTDQQDSRVEKSEKKSGDEEMYVQIDKNIYRCPPIEDYSDIARYEYQSFASKEKEKQIAFESATESEKTNSLLPSDMSKAKVKILGSTKLKREDMIKLTFELGISDDCLVLEEHNESMQDEMVDLMNGQYSDVLVGKILNKKGISVETRVIDTIHRNRRKYPNMILNGNPISHITTTSLKESLRKTLKYQYLNKTGHFKD